MIEIKQLLKDIGRIINDFWKKLVEWIKETLSELSNKVNGTIWGVSAQIQKVKKIFKDFCAEITVYYSKIGTTWNETTVTKVISEEEVPEDILRRAKANEKIDITKDMELALGLS